MLRKSLIWPVAAFAGLLAAVLPSGAGQHFGILGGVVDSFSSVAAGSTGPSPQVTASGFFAFGQSVDVIDPASAPAVSLSRFSGCVSVATPQGSDWGCVRDEGLTTIQDLTGSTVRATIPSRAFPGGAITVSLQFDTTGFAPFPAVTGSPPDSDLNFTLSAHVGQAAAVSGTVVSSTVGGGSVEPAAGSVFRGATVTSCSHQGSVCPLDAA